MEPSGIGLQMDVQVGYGIHAARGPFSTDRTKRLALKPLDLSGIGSALALEVKMLTNCVVKQAHATKPTRR
jgi:hypothetical protein